MMMEQSGTSFIAGTLHRTRFGSIGHILRTATVGLFSSEKRKDFGTVLFLFVCDKYYQIMN